MFDDATMQRLREIRQRIDPKGEDDAAFLWRCFVAAMVKLTDDPGSRYELIGASFGAGRR